MPALLTVDQAAEALGVKPATIRSWIYHREKLAIVKIGRAVRIPETSVRKLIEDNTYNPARPRR